MLDAERYILGIFHFAGGAMQTAKLFFNGRSQAVRLPKAFRFDGLTEVFIERDGDRVILSPGKRPSIERLIAALDEFESFPERGQPAVADTREAW
jgi:antitoxin VapB